MSFCNRKFVSTSVSLCLIYFVNKFICLIFKVHIYMISYDICLSLSDFTQYDNLQIHPHCYKWQYSVLFRDQIIFYCVYVPHLLCLFICRWTLRFLPYTDCCKQCCIEYCGAYNLFKLEFLSFLNTCTQVGLLAHVTALFLVFKRKFHSVFHMATLIYIPTNSVEFFSILSAVFIIYGLLKDRCFNWYEVIVHVVLIGIFTIIISIVEHLFMFLLAIYASCLEKCLFRSLVLLILRHLHNVLHRSYIYSTM